MDFKLITLSGFLLVLVACQAKHDTQHYEKSLDAAIADTEKTVSPKKQGVPDLPDAVHQTLMPRSEQADDALFGEPKFDINAQQIDAVSFFAGIVEDTPFSVAIHPSVSGLITLNLKQVTLEQIFDIVTEIYGYDVQRRQNIYRIYPSGMRTETFAVNYLLMKRDGATQTSITSGGVSQAQNSSSSSSGSSLNSFSGNSSSGSSNNLNSGSNGNGTSISTSTETDFWTDLLASLQVMIGAEEGRSVMVMPQAGLVTVRAMPSEIRSVKEFLAISEEHVQRQVILEARILEVSLSDGYQQGINWTEVLANSGSTDFQFSTTAGSLGDAISASLGGITSLSFVNKDFSGVLNLLQTQGNVQVLSSPRVTAINNQKAVIKVGDDEYFVTDVSSQSTVTAATSSTTPNIELTPFFSGIALDVTPQIDAQGGVLLHVHPSVIETEEQEKVVTLNEEQFVLPLAASNIRESDTIIHARSGEIVVIGGLMQSIISETESKTPLLGDIPLLGNLFKNRQETETKKELVILLRPTVVGADTWRQQLIRSRNQMADWLHVD
ncbi:pilus (MSHA type) biogenesis protein MshL [Paraglaciecola sp. T6c]|uniref:pilus (MSHA type) biogenesis protein MshL n=1 Tax=Pseudoalteromonas atlantica (strain T6c / ATCC BAA-1087) TaxID=3042615 RepID=UPI0000DA6D69|nr:pilus (MSHA type) biogenesis protein MshL [Paraglaciecola sp. T6c]ABG38702.1 pilus (MSHA type) biogenesis protein MshL [Paraglaciecola sp. T6c]